MPLRIAVFSPLAPLPTALADHVEGFLPHLARGADIELFIGDGYEPTNPAIVQLFTIHSHRVFAERAGQYDIVLYAIGSHAKYCSYTFEAMQRFPGIAMWHDAALDERSVSTYRLIDHVLDFSLGVIVNSNCARREMLRRRPGATVACIAQHFCVPSGFPGNADIIGLQAKWGLESRLVVGSFGWFTADNRLDICLRAFSHLLESRPDAVYLLCGAPSPGYDLAGLIKAAGLGENVILTGGMDPVPFTEHMQAVDMAIQLETPHVGSTPLIPIRLMGLGVPCIVSDTETLAELPEGACAKLPPDEHEAKTLTALLAYLAGDDRLRRRMGKNGQEYVRAYHSAERIAEQYLHVISKIASPPPDQPQATSETGPRDHLIQDVASIAAGWGVAETDDYLLAPISQAIGELFALPAEEQD